MRARVAYISSLGTTAILVAAALLMLAVVSAIVAFRGWPGGEAGSGVQSVPLAPPGIGASSTLAARPVSFRTRVARAPARSAALVAVAARRTASTKGLVKQPGGGPLVHGLVMVSVPGAMMHPASPRSSSPAGPAGVPTPAASPAQPGSPPTAPVPTTGPVGVPVPIPSVPSPPAPTSDALAAAVDSLLGSSPPPPVAAVVHLLSR